MTLQAPAAPARRRALVHGTSLVMEKLLRGVIHPRLRAGLLRFAGASIGKNVRIYESQFFNLALGFRNLEIEEDAHVGPGCLLDLKGPLRLRRGAVLSPRVTILTHHDPGADHGSPLARRFPPASRGVEIGAYSWIGAAAVVLDGVHIGARAVVAAGAVVIRDVEPESVVGGVPARALRGAL
jgi:acetyltransferase-like isoleucine patch superfamily enzyme